MHLMNEPSFQRHQTRWKIYQTKIDDPTLADQKIVPAMLLLNKLPGLVTVFSCQGHPSVTRPIAKGYFMLGVTNPKWLYRFYEVLVEEFGVNSQRTNIRLVQKRDTTLPRAIEKWTPMWIVDWHVNVQQAQCDWDIINEAAVKVFEEYTAEEARVDEILRW